MTDTINVPLLPTKEMLDAATSHALSVNIGGHYTWSDYMRDLYVLMITSTPAQPAPVQGWQIVPVEPSEKMLDILYHNGPGLSDHLLVAIWAELLAAAPKPPVQGWMLVPADLIDNFPEINPNNYDHDQVCDLNDWGCDLVRAAIAAPQPSDDVARDAARYRWLLEQSGFGIRRNGVTELTVAFYEVQPDNIGQLSFAIDAAMGQGGSDE